MTVMTKRDDLLSLSEDDLVTLSNRGTVKRANKEMDKGDLTYDITLTEAGDLIVKWSDGVACNFPAGEALADCECSDSAVGISRNLIRSVLAYQQWAAQQAPEDSEPTPQHPWNPGVISDEELGKHYPKQKLTRVRKQFEEGLVIELVRSTRPTALLHSFGCAVRFMVEGDIRYTYCDCEESAPCSHVPLAVWAFRMLEDDRISGIIETHVVPLDVPEDIIEDTYKTLYDLLETGINGASNAVITRLQRLRKRCDEEGLIWPAEILDEIMQEHERYTKRDSLFSPTHVAQLIGELLIRLQAIRNQTGAVPDLFVRGSQNDRETKISKSRLIGLGCAATIMKGGAKLSAYLQDSDSGTIIVMEKEFPDPDAKLNSKPDSFHKLSRASVIKNTSLGSIGSKQLLVTGGKRTAGYTYKPGRANASINPQTFNWDSLHAPILADGFEEILARASAQPPATLRPRRPGEDFYVCALKGVQTVRFDNASQTVQALLIDSEDKLAMMVHPYTSRGAEGVENLLWWLNNHPDEILYVSGKFKPGHIGLVIHPISLIFEGQGHRHMVQPWIDSHEKGRDYAFNPQSNESRMYTSATSYYPAQVVDAIGELMLIGLVRADDVLIRQWEILLEEGRGLGFTRFIAPIEALTKQLTHKRSTLEWDWREAAHLMLRIITLARFAQEQTDV